MKWGSATLAANLDGNDSPALREQAARVEPAARAGDRSMAALRPDERGMLALLSKRTRPKRGGAQGSPRNQK
jgi:hypothetical protein